MLIKNISGSRMFFKFVSKYGKWLENNETTTVDDSLSLNEEFLRCKNTYHYLDTISYSEEDDSIVVQKELQDATSPGIVRMIPKKFTCTAGQTAFSLDVTPDNGDEISFFWNGLLQKDDYYSYADNVVTWTGFTMALGDKVVIKYLSTGVAE